MKNGCVSKSSTIVILCTPLVGWVITLVGLQEGKFPRETQETEMDGYLLSDNNIVVQASCRSLLLLILLLISDNPALC